MSETNSFRRSGPLAAGFLVLCVGIIYWPGIHGFWGRDDFSQLAMVRLLGSPWPLFTQDHFVVPGSVFRPLGFASMWLSTAVLGTDYARNAMADLALHAAVGLALFALLRRARIPTAIALVCVLLFALHPVVLGTALWWSARFDLLAALFVLLALNAALAYRDRAHGVALAASLLALVAAMASKETGLAALVPISLVGLRWAWREPARRTRALTAVALAWTCAIAWFLWRWHVLGTPASGLTGTVPLTEAIAKGLVDWALQVFGYLSFWARLQDTQRVALVIAVVGAALAIGACVRRRATRASSDLVEVALVGLCLFVIPAFLQAPAAGMNAAPLSAGVSAIEAAMQSRLHYLGIAGVSILCAALFAAVWGASSTRFRLALITPLVLTLLVFASASRESARLFAARSVEIATVANAAVEAVARIDLPASGCHVVFLDVQPASEWSVFVSMDSIVKALSRDLDRVASCWFEANYVTWFHLQRAPTMPVDAAPFPAFEIDGKALPWRRIGNLVIALLRAPERVDTADLSRMTFLRYRDGHFEDVTADVVAGRLPANLDLSAPAG